VTTKRLILCSDGTGNSGGKARATNVWRLFQAVAAQGGNGQGQVVAQLKMHDDGVGADEFSVKANMPYVCGLPDPAGKTPAELDRLAEAALRAYKPRHWYSEPASSRICQPTDFRYRFSV